MNATLEMISHNCLHKGTQILQYEENFGHEKKERIRIRSLILDVIKAVLHKRKPQQISLRVGEGGASLESDSQKKKRGKNVYCLKC